MIEVGIVIPTLGTRHELLLDCLRTVKSEIPVFVVLVKPESSLNLKPQVLELCDLIIDDPKSGLAAAIHAGVLALPESILYFNWLGDDDLLMENSLKTALTTLKSNPEVVFVYGKCDYVDENNNLLWKNRSGKYAKPLLHFGPQLIPQPGALIRRDAYSAIGGLNTSYKWAFDLDLLFRLKREGEFQFVDATLAKFRWHEGSLSVGGRRGSVEEASIIRRTFLPKSLRWFSPIWEVPLKSVILFAGYRLNRKIKYLRG